MENDFLDKVEDNVVVRIWSEETQLAKGDSLSRGYTSELWDYTRISVTQNSLQELKEIWDQWNDEIKQLFYSNYGDLPYLFDVKVDEQLFRALPQYWNPAYSCFTFGKVDLVPTVEAYTALLCCPRFQVDKAYSRASYVPAFWKKLMNITGMSEQWITARITKKGECKCIPWKNLQDLILAHPDGKKKVDLFALSIYGLVIFPRALGYVDEAVDRISYRVFSETYSPLKELVATPRRDNISKENWIALLQNLQEENVEWRAPWLIPDRILYRCGIFDWVPLLGIWGFVGYAPLFVLRQYSSRQFVPVTHGLAQYEFSYRGDNYKKKVKEISQACNQTRRMKRLAVGSMTTPEYSEWWSKRINDNIPESNSKDARPMEQYLQVIPSELEIIKQDFERRNQELEKKIGQLEEEKMHLRLDTDVQKLEAEKLRKGKSKVEEDLNSLKTDYKKLRLSMRTARLGKTSEQWRQEILEEKGKADR
ncbi:hypothetical protein Goshw_023702 [Gossypium schwendimanii]|uniref:DUF7745 domain-containing protein n=1 Tax=Gossypium schwendimanii TaxID=34291 RepID=A0A7J9N551_GOSSC|nr:hypothetical protein [Gossypium schwendimanii]